MLVVFLYKQKPFTRRYLRSLDSYNLILLSPLNMAFSLYRGKAQVKFYPKTASTALANGDLVQLSSGKLIKATTTSLLHCGVVLRDVVATDADYASTTSLPVLVPNDDTEFLVDVGTGTLTTAMVGETHDLTDADSIDVTAAAKDVVTITGFVSASKAIVKINSNIAYKNAA